MNKKTDIFLTAYAVRCIISYSGDGAGGDEAPGARSSFPDIVPPSAPAPNGPLNWGAPGAAGHKPDPLLS